MAVALPRAALALLFLSSCGGTGSDEATTGTPAAGTQMVDGFFTAQGAPPPLACVEASECIGDTISAANGCCQNPTSLRTHSRAYRSWVFEWRTGHCEGVVCPPPPSPSRPPSCAFEVRCEEGQCRDSCDEPPPAHAVEGREAD